jgi:tryptophan synthase alpha chain
MTGIERIQWSFSQRKEGKKCLLAFLTAGDPNLAESEKLLSQALKFVDILEIGIPFSDPLADGPVIQSSYARALQAGVKLADVFALAQRLRSQTDKPLVFMTYINVLLQKGFTSFVDEVARCGVDGLIIPDLPPDEADELIAYCQKRGIALNFLVAPTSTDERIQSAVSASTGFVYVVSLRGVTGARRELSRDLPAFVERVKSQTDLPLAVGFGISNPEQAQKAANLTDGVIVGSALVNIMATETTPEDRERCLVERLEALRKAVS